MNGKNENKRKRKEKKPFETLEYILDASTFTILTN